MREKWAYLGSENCAAQGRGTEPPERAQTLLPGRKMNGRCLRKCLPVWFRISLSILYRTSHESAHTLGAVHDCTSTTCGSSTECCPLSSSTCDADGEYIMNPTSWSGMTRFSPCTIGAVCSKLGSGQVSTDCLLDSRYDNAPESTSTCGNGIVEPGEACDCGQNACSEEDTRCCDSLTCQWRAGNECSRDGSDGDTDDGNGDSGDDDSFGDSSWWSQNYREVIIGASVGGGGLVLVIILISTIVFWRRRRRRQRTGPISKVTSTG